MQLGDEGTRAPIICASARTISPKMRQNQAFLQWSLIMQLTAFLQQLFTFCCYDVVHQILNDGYCPTRVL
jgi:hypothetical protein